MLLGVRARSVAPERELGNTGHVEIVLKQLTQLDNALRGRDVRTDCRHPPGADIADDGLGILRGRAAPGQRNNEGERHPHRHQHAKHQRQSRRCRYLDRHGMPLLSGCGLRH